MEEFSAQILFAGKGRFLTRVAGLGQSKFAALF